MPGNQSNSKRNSKKSPLVFHKKKRKIEEVKLSIQSIEKAYVGNKTIINVKAKPERYVRLMEATITDPMLRQQVLKLKKISRGSFDLRFKPKMIGKYIISFYAISKQNLFRREEITFDIVEAPIIPISNEKTTISEDDFAIDMSKVKKRNWPSSSAYSIALQNPKNAISDIYPQIRNGIFQQNPRVKYPTLIFGSGNFGTVFNLKADSGNYAIKCFTRGSPDLEIRYQAISRQLNGKKFPFFTEFNYMDNAVRVMDKKDTYYPVLMMSWVSGENLNQYITRNLKDSKLLVTTAKSLLGAVQDMVRNKIAHGDLSGDNILVAADGSVSLIDYDGMYVPPIAKLGASEAGHEAFQHPKRSTEFNEKLDFFSCLLIYATLHALSKKPELWEYNNGDGDKLIISGDDLKDPSKSDVLKDMKKIGGKVKTLTDLMIRSLSKESDWDQISPLLLS